MVNHVGKLLFPFVTLGAWLCGVAPLARAFGADSAALCLHWRAMPSLPDAEGFAGMFAGVDGDALLLAGGANFPEKRPWDGGAKHWHDAIWLLDRPDGAWRKIARLPRANAYGISASTPAGLIFAGGGDGQRHYRDVYRIAWRDGRLDLENLPPLPQTCSFASGAVANGTMYICGGIDHPDATTCLRTFWALDTRQGNLAWRALEPCPGVERMLAVAGVDGDDFYLFSGQRLSADPPRRAAREFLRDAWRYRPGQGWRRLADLPRAAVAAPSPAPRQADGRLLVMSGDDGEKITFKPESEHPGFPRDVLAYDLARDAWEVVGEAPFSRATAPTAEWRGMTIVPSGEARPGYRSAEVWALLVGEK